MRRTLNLYTLSERPSSVSSLLLPPPRKRCKNIEKHHSRDSRTPSSPCFFRSNKRLYRDCSTCRIACSCSLHGGIMCSQMLDPPHALHPLLMPLCSQMLDPPHCLHTLLWRLGAYGGGAGGVCAHGLYDTPAETRTMATEYYLAREIN